MPPVGSSGTLKHVASGLCAIGGEAQQHQVVLGECQAGTLAQTWVHDATGALHLQTLDKGMCAAVRNFVGPQVRMSAPL